MTQLREMLEGRRFNGYESAMQRIQAFALALFCCTLAGKGSDFGEWQSVGTKDGVSLSKRQNATTGLSEFRAKGVVEAPVADVLKILEDVKAAPEYMPYVKEVKVLSRSSGRQVFYQRIQPPFVTERDYTLDFVKTSRTTPSGRAYRLTWTTANDKGPGEREGVVRVQVNEGFWDLAPTEDGKSTSLGYSVYTDIGASIPAFLVKKGNLIALPKLYRAIRKRVGAGS